MKNELGWEKVLSGSAKVVIPKFGIILHGVDNATMDLNKKDAVMKILRDENAVNTPNLDIDYIGYLRKDGATLPVTSIVIELNSAEQANQAIHRSLIWNSQQLSVTRYERACRMCQCFKCWQYGHVSDSCPSDTDKCGHCAGPHRSGDCPSSDQQKKCAVCTKAHAAWDTKCVYRQKELARMERARDNSPRFWPEATRTKPPPTPSPTTIQSTPETSPPQSQGATGGVDSSTSMEAETTAGFTVVGRKYKTPKATTKRKATFTPPKKADKFRINSDRRAVLQDVSTKFNQQLNQLVENPFEKTSPLKSARAISQRAQSQAGEENNHPAEKGQDFLPESTQENETESINTNTSVSESLPSTGSLGRGQRTKTPTYKAS